MKRSLYKIRLRAGFSYAESGLPLAAATDQNPVYLLGLVTAYIGAQDLDGWKAIVDELLGSLEA